MLRNEYLSEKLIEKCIQVYLATVSMTVKKRSLNIQKNATPYPEGSPSAG